MVANQQRVSEFITTFGAIFFACAIANGAPPIPIVEFDVAQVIACHEVGSSKGKPRKIIEVVFKISPSIERGAEKDLTTLDYTISTISGNERKPISSIHSFIPETELYTDIIGPISIIEEKINEKSVTVSATYSRSATVKVVKAEDKKTAEATIKTISRSTIQYKKLPPKAIFRVSGTKDRRRTVFYKLKPSTQHTLEGERVFGVMFKVPSDWTGDSIQVTCKAKGFDRGWWFFSDKIVASGLGTFAVGLHLEGDEKARTLAIKMAKEQDTKNKKLAKAAEGARVAKTSWLQRVWERLFFNLSPKAMGPALSYKMLFDEEAQKENAEITAPFEKAKLELEKLSGTTK